jgi:hypothetical protein
MTRDEFIDRYIANSTPRYTYRRTRLGYSIDGEHWLALPCDCGEENCHGWAMMPNDLIAIILHCDLHANGRVRDFDVRCSHCGHKWQLAFAPYVIDRLMQRGYAACPQCRRGPLGLKVESYRNA